MPNITVCPLCGACYEESSEENAKLRAALEAWLLADKFDEPHPAGGKYLERVEARRLTAEAMGEKP